MPCPAIGVPGILQSYGDFGLSCVYFVGDLLAMQMVQSFWNLLGHEKELYFMNKNITYHRYHFNTTIECPNHRCGLRLSIQYA
jgi:hypothetical protein